MTFLCAKWIHLPDGVARCDLARGHEGQHVDSVILVGFEDKDVNDRVKPHQHYKGGLYSVITTTAHFEKSPESNQQVVYRSMSDGKVWIRDFNDFHEKLPTPLGVDRLGRIVVPPGGFVRRFQPLPDWKQDEPTGIYSAMSPKSS